MTQCDLIAFDTEDDSKRFSDARQDHAGYEKVCTICKHRERIKGGQAVSASIQCAKCLRSCRPSKSGKSWVCTICKHRERIKP